MSKQQNPKIKVKRFSKAFVIAHAVNAISFITLYLTALPMYTEFFDWLYPVFGGPETARLLHRIFAFAFMTPTIIFLVFDHKGFFRWMKELVTWKKRDIQFLKETAKGLFGLKTKHVRQSFYNAGEKINSWIQIITTIIIICSGIMMMRPEIFPKAMVQWAYFFHNVGFGLAVVVVIGHIYLAIIDKDASPGKSGVVTGKVPAWWAHSHYTEWYEEEVKKGNFPRLNHHH